MRPFISEEVYIAPSGVQKELMKPSDLYVLSLAQTLEKHKATAQDGPIRPSSRVYLRSPAQFKPSQCTPLFLSAFTRRGAKCCIHTHSPWAVLVTLILEQQGQGNDKEFRINNIEQIKGFAKGYPHSQVGNLGYHDTLRIPIIENTAHEEDLTEFMEEAMERYPDAYAVLVRRHGVYVWGNTVEQAKGQCERYVIQTVLGFKTEFDGMATAATLAVVPQFPCYISLDANSCHSLDYLFQIAVEMKKLGIPWVSDIEPTLPKNSLRGQ